MGPTSNNKKWVVASLLFVYLWFFVLEDDGSSIGPEDLEKYRQDLSEWVEDNEEELRAIHSERRENVKNVCEKYGINRKTPEVPKAAWDLGLVSTEWNFLKRVNWYYIYLSR